MHKDILLSEQTLPVADLLAKAISAEDGGVVSFVGVVRQHTQGRVVSRLEYEAYVPMAVRQINHLVQSLGQQWTSVNYVLVHHRIGVLLPGEVAVVLIVGAPHRQEAFAACQWLIDQLKAQVPIWKKEVFADGAVWVAAHP